MDNRAIGVFDSGVGGLTVLRSLIEHFPQESFIYAGDTARVPYGNKTAATLQEYAAQCTRFLTRKNVKLIVVACNSLSATAMDTIANIAEVPVVGVINPAARKALLESPAGHIGIIATRATVRSRAYDTALRSIAGSESLHILSHACPLFVPLAEEGFVQHPATELIANTYLSPFRDVQTDTLILGCTHFPILREVIAKLLPDVNLIESGGAAADEVQQILASKAAFSDLEKSIINVYLSDITPSFKAIANRILGIQPNKVEKVTFS